MNVHFHVCSCGLHGFIAREGSPHVNNFHAKSEAYDVVYRFLADGALNRRQARKLGEMINASRIPDTPAPEAVDYTTRLGSDPATCAPAIH